MDDAQGQWHAPPPALASSSGDGNMQSLAYLQRGKSSNASELLDDKARQSIQADLYPEFGSDLSSKSRKETSPKYQCPSCKLDITDITSYKVWTPKMDLSDYSQNQSHWEACRRNRDYHQHKFICKEKSCHEAFSRHDHLQVLMNTVFKTG